MKIQHSDGKYFPSSYRRAIVMYACNCCTLCDRLSVCLSHGKGGYGDCDVRILHSRGGSPKAEGVAGHDMEGNQEETLDRSQDRRVVSHYSRRSTILPGPDTDSAIREDSGKLTSLSAAVTRHSSEAQPTDESLARNRCLFCSIAYLVWQRKQAEACYLFVRKRDME